MVPGPKSSVEHAHKFGEDWTCDFGNMLVVRHTGDESVPIQLAQCWFPGLAISNAKIEIYFSNKIHRSNFIKQHSRKLLKLTKCSLKL